ncbi:hypothetical protein D3C84_973530 [compost metagenome]
MLIIKITANTWTIRHTGKLRLQVIQLARLLVDTLIFNLGHFTVEFFQAITRHISARLRRHITDQHKTFTPQLFRRRGSVKSMTVAFGMLAPILIKIHAKQNNVIVRTAVFIAVLTHQVITQFSAVMLSQRTNVFNYIQRH